MIVKAVGGALAGPFYTSVQVEIEWNPEDPAAVSFTFIQGGDETKWTFARQLLIDSLEDGEAGEGAVQLREAGNWMAMTLVGEDGVGRVHVPLDDVDNLLADSLQVIPVQRESYDWDAIVHDLLKDT